MGAQCCGSGGAVVAREDEPAFVVHMKRRMCAKPDAPDPRDKVLSWPELASSRLPPLVDLRSKNPFPLYDQGDLGSCTASAICGAFQFSGYQQDPTFEFQPSRLFVYYNARVMEGTVQKDAGCDMRNCLKSLHKKGTCDEREWPHIMEKFADKAPDNCYLDAVAHKVAAYARVNDSLADFKECLNRGFPFAFGMVCFSSFLTREVMMTGEMKMPSLPFDSYMGKHSGLAVGYDDSKKSFIIRNSWGGDWGQGGHFYMPYDFMTNWLFTFDHWAITSLASAADFPTAVVDGEWLTRHADAHSQLVARGWLPPLDSGA